MVGAAVVGATDGVACPPENAHDYMLAAMMRFVTLMGTDPFLPIIRLAERTNPMKPRLSRDATGS